MEKGIAGTEAVHRNDFARGIDRLFALKDICKSRGHRWERRVYIGLEKL
jgi:hypothetical protein